MQPQGNFTMPESPPPGYMSEDSEYSETTALSSPSSSVGFTGEQDELFYKKKCLSSLFDYTDT